MVEDGANPRRRSVQPCSCCGDDEQARSRGSPGRALPMFYLMCVAVLLIWYFPDLVHVVAAAHGWLSEGMNEYAAKIRAPFAVLELRTNGVASVLRLSLFARNDETCACTAQCAGRTHRGRDRALSRRRQRSGSRCRRSRRRGHRSSAECGRRSAPFRSPSRARMAKSRAVHTAPARWASLSARTVSRSHHSCHRVVGSAARWASS